MEPPSCLKPGDMCLDCQQDGLQHHLRNFLINSSDVLLKCESDTCMYPYNDDISSDSSFSTLTDNEGECKKEFDLFALNSSPKVVPKLQSNSLPAEFQEIKLISKPRSRRKKSFKKQQSDLTQQSPTQQDIPHISMPNLFAIKEEPMFNFIPQSQAKKPKVQIQSITFIKKEEPICTQVLSTKTSVGNISLLAATKHEKDCISQFSMNPSTSNKMSLDTKRTHDTTKGLQLLPKASLVKGHQFLDVVNATDKNKPFVNHKCKAIRPKTKKGK